MKRGSAPICLAALILLLLAARPAAASVLGVNAHIPSSAAVQRMADAGVGWARIDFVWAFIEPRRGEYDWSLYDRVVADLEHHGIEVYATLQGTPAWATSGAEFSGVPDDPDTWRDLCFRAADRYRGRVRVWSLWNEPNLSRFWQGTRNHFLDTILINGAEAIHAADPKALIAGGELAHLQSGSWDDWLPAIASVGVDTLDVIAHHVYPSNDTAGDVTNKLSRKPDFPWEPPSVRDVLQRTPWWGRPIWLTETGVAADDSVSEFAQFLFVRNLPRQWFGAGRQQSWLGRIMFYELADDPNAEDQFGLLGPSPDYEPKMAWAALADSLASAEIDDARIVVFDPTEFISSHETRAAIRVVLRNTGTSTWSRANGDRVGLTIDQADWNVSAGLLPQNTVIDPGGVLDLTLFAYPPLNPVGDPIQARVVVRMLRGLAAIPFGDAAHGIITLTDQPVPKARATYRTFLVAPGGSATLSLDVGAETSVAQRWRRNSIDLEDGPRISGATDTTIELSDIDVSLEGVYDCVVEGPGGSVVVPAGRVRLIETPDPGPDPRRGRDRHVARPARWNAWHAFRFHDSSQSAW